MGLLSFIFGRKGIGAPLDVVSYEIGKKTGGGAWNTFTGSIVRFLASKSAPIRSIIASIAPVQVGSGDPSQDNVRPISGWTAANVYRTGKNLLPAKFYTGIPYNANAGTQITLTADTSVTESGDEFSKDVSSWGGTDMVSERLKPGTYKLNIAFSATSARSSLYVLNADMTISRRLGNSSEDGTWESTVVITGDEAYIAVIIASAVQGSVKLTAPQIELGSTATAYHAYTGTSLVIPFTVNGDTKTIYGGTVSVDEDGAVKLTATKALYYADGSVIVPIVSYHSTSGLYYVVVNNSLTSINTTADEGHLISSRFVTINGVAIGRTYITGAGKTLVAVLPDQTITTKEAATAWFADNPTQFVYDLAEPVEYDLSDVTVLSTLVGTNVMWADTGDITVTARGTEIPDSE